MFKSKGLKRNLASVLAAFAAVAQFVPALAPYNELLINLAGFFGVAGVAHAAAADTLEIK
jgi:hypothetical protein